MGQGASPSQLKQMRHSVPTESLQDDLDNLSKWSDQWLLRYNAAKCKVMHVSHTFPTVYKVRDGQNTLEFSVVKEEKALGVFTTNKLKSGRQCAAVSAKAMSLLGLIRRHFKNIYISNFKQLYTTYIHLHLECCIQAWSPYLVKDIACLEKV